MPASDTERRVLSIALSDPEALATIFASLRAQDFAVPAHRSLFEAVSDLYRGNQRVDAVTVGQYLVDRDRAGELALATELVGEYTSSSGLESYISIIAEDAVRAELKLFAKRVEREAGTRTTDIYEVTWKLEKELLDVMLRGRTASFKVFRDVARAAYDKIKAMERRERSITGVPSGFAAIDAVTNGFQPGELVILAARPGMGKTAFALNVAVNAAKELKLGEGAGRDVVVIFSLEMGAEQLLMRMLSSESQISQSDLKVGRVQNRWAALTQAVEELENLDIMVDDSTALTVVDIYARLKKLSSTRNVKLVVVDYLQLLRGDASVRNRGDNRQQEVAQISRLLKSYAREFAAPFIVLAQLNREVEKRGNPRPLLADLRESGAIEQDADIVSFLITPNNYANSLSQQKGAEDQDAVDPLESNRAEYIIAKNRNGPTKDVSLMCDMTTGTFGDWEVR